MKRFLLIIMCIAMAILSLTGCMSKNQLLAEQSFYAAKVALAKQQSSQPIFEMVAANAKDPIILQNVSAIRVFQAPSSGGNDGLQQYIQKDYASAWVNAFLQMVPLRQMSPHQFVLELFHGPTLAFKDVAMQPHSITNTNVSASGSSQAMSGGMMTNTTTSYANTVSGTGNVANIGGTVNQATATPTVVVVEQPPPVIVPPSYPPATPAP